MGQGMDKQIAVKLTDREILKHSTVKPIDALLQIIFNAIDAESSRVDIITKKDESGLDPQEIPLSYISEIQVIDRGYGIDIDKVELYFSQFGQSWKQGNKRTDGREYHGKNGLGRFKYLALGKSINWQTIHKKGNSNFQYEMTLNYDFPKTMSIKNDKETSADTGTIVTITDLTPKASTLTDKDIIHTILESIGLYIKNSLGKFHITVNGEEIIPDNYIEKEESGVFVFNDDEKSYNFNYEFIAWKKEFKFTNHKHTFIYDQNKNYVGYCPSGTQAGNNLPSHTVLLISDYYNSYSQYNDEFRDKFSRIQKNYRNKLNRFLFMVKRLRSREEFMEFTEQDFYPFDDKQLDEIEEAERNLFDICAYSLLENNQKFMSKKTHSLTLCFKLLKKFIEKDKNIAANLSELLDLSPESAEDFKDVCNSSKLPQLVTHYKELQERKAFLDLLDTLVHDDFYKTHLKERTQLHKIVEKNLWIFGDEFDYTLGTSDQRLTKVLSVHLQNKELSDEQIEEIESEINQEVDKAESCLKKIPDLYLWRKFDRRNTTTTDNLIIELKAPKVSIGVGNIPQGKKVYKGIIEAKGIDISEKNKWRYYFVSTDFTKGLEAEFTGSSQDQIISNYQNGNYIIGCLKWEQIIQTARFKLDEVLKELEVEISEEKKQNLLDKYLNEVGFDK